MIKEAIILAGGTGTRLRSVITEIPKPMAPIGNKPFLAIILDKLNSHGVEHVILAVGYKHEVIQSYFGNQFKNITLDYAIEEEPLGTGGAVGLALNQLYRDAFLMMNGDTLFDVNFDKLCQFHFARKADLSMSLKPIRNQDRYGLVKVDESAQVIEFTEKKYIDQGLINGGVYATSKSFINSLNLPQKYSWEKDMLEKQSINSNFFGYLSDSYFIDIGIPADYTRAQLELT